MGSNAVQVMTLANSIIGVSVLAMPYCFKQCGIVLSVLLLCLSSILSRLACHFLLKAAIITRRRNYEFLAFHVFGSTGKLGVELAIIGFLLGTCVAFFVVMGDLGPAIISSMFAVHRTDTLRTSILISMAFFVVLPLGLLRNVDSLSSLCTASIAFYLCLVLKVMGEAAGPMVSGDWLNQVNFWRPEGVLQCLPIFSMALFCQTQLFEIFDTVPNAALDKLNAVIRVAINMCTAMYILVGFFGYVAFSKENITGNILVSLSQTMSSEVIKLGFVLSVAVSFPLVIFPCRASLYSLLYRSAQPPVHDMAASHVPEGRFKLLTFGIVGVSLVVGLLLPNIERVLGIIGSTIGVTICIILPSLLLGNTARHSKDRLASQIILWSGAIIMILGTYAHILNGESAGAVDPGLEQVANRILDQAVDRLNEQPHEAVGFQLAPSDKVVKKLIETSEEKARDQLSGSRSEKNKPNVQSISGSSYDKSSLSKDGQAKLALIKEEKSSAKVSESEVADKPIKVHEKIQEPAVPADTGEKQQEPAVPVEAVVKRASAEPVVPVMPAPSSESTLKELKLPKRKTKMKEQVLAQKNKTVIAPSEQVNQDAIRHEDAESALEARDNKEKNNGMDKGEQKQTELEEQKKKNEESAMEEQKKKDEEQKLIDTLKEHQEVQRDMLNEQQRILQELKKHEKEHEKSANEVKKDSPAKSAPSQNLDIEIIDNGPKPVPEQNSRSLQLPEKELAKKDFPNLRISNVLSNNQLKPPAIPSEGKPAVPVPYPKGSKFGKALPVMPIPLAYSAKVPSSPPPAKIIPNHVDAKAAARDILESGVQHSDREKRDLVFVSNIETDQGAGNGPVVVEEKKLSDDAQVTLLEYSKEECKPNGDDAAQKLKFQDPPIVSASSVSVTGSENVVIPHVEQGLHPIRGVKESNDGKVQKDLTVQNAGKAKEPPAMELKTPSSISEPQIEIHTGPHGEGQKLSGKNLPLSEINYLKPIQRKDGDLLQ